VLTGSALAAWFVTKVLPILIASLGKIALDAINQRHAEASEREAGGLTVAVAQAATAARVEHALAEEAGKAPSEDDVLARLARGDG
jgi:hypothetical protein